MRVLVCSSLSTSAKVRKTRLKPVCVRNLGFISPDGCRASFAFSMLVKVYTLYCKSICTYMACMADIVFIITIILDWVHLMCHISSHF